MRRLKAQIWSIARSPGFWIITSMMMLGLVGQALGIDYLMIPAVSLIVGVLPLVGSHYAVKFGVAYVRVIKLIESLWPPNRSNRVEYYFSQEFSQSEPKLREPVFHTMTSVFGVIYTVYTVLQFFVPSLSEPGARTLLIIALMLPSLILSSAISTSAWLFRLLGYTYENKTNGDRVNFGKDVRSRLARVIGIPAAISFGYMFFKSPADFGEGITAILLIITFCTPSTIFSFYVLRKVHLERMKNELRSKLLL